ncbi:MAG: ABC transporter permease [Actinomycetota bacterium]
MSLGRVLLLLRKDLRLGPRSPVFLWVLVLPLLITLVLQVAFGDLFDPRSRLGIVDEGASAVTAAARQVPGIEGVLVDSAQGLKAKVEANDLDAGLVLPRGFDAALQAGERPLLQFYVGGESAASDRAVLTATTLDLVRRVAGSPTPVEVEVAALGEKALPITVRLVPLIAMYALLVAGVFLPSFSLADEREKRTLHALVVTPVRLSEVVVAKGSLGFLLAVPMAVVTLWINQALTGRPLALLVVLVVAGGLLTELGLVYGTVAGNVTTVFTLIKGTGFLLLAPTVFYLFPDWPQWIARIFPTYWVINPVYEVTIEGAGLGEVWVELLIALGVAMLLGLVVATTTRRLKRQMAAA